MVEGKQACQACLSEGAQKAVRVRAALSPEEKRYQSRERRRKVRAEVLRLRREVASEVLSEWRERLGESLAAAARQNQQEGNHA